MSPVFSLLSCLSVCVFIVCLHSLGAGVINFDGQGVISYRFKVFFLAWYFDWAHSFLGLPANNKPPGWRTCAPVCAGEKDEDHQGRDRTEVQDFGQRWRDSPWGRPAGRLHHLGAAQGKAAAADKSGWATRGYTHTQLSRQDPACLCYLSKILFTLVFSSKAILHFRQ